MRVSRIEAFGFKSFMERIVLPLNGGITGVVGPNGCGKSNVVDAVRWVLGETRAKSLRGGVLEDIIFNGTDQLRPLGLAEVTLTLQSTQDNLLADLVSPEMEAAAVAAGTEEAEQPQAEPIKLNNQVEVQTLAAADTGRESVEEVALTTETAEEQAPIEPSEESAEVPAEEDIDLEFSSKSEIAAGSLLQKYSWLKAASEVQITRRLYRSGESEFFINRVPCRLKDLKDFFRAVGLSAKGFTIVAQGEISRIITAKPQDRRKLLEEAAGVQGFRDKITSTQNRINDTRGNLERVGDIVREVSRQVGSLKRQANKAKNRDLLKTNILELDVRTFRSRLAKAEREWSATQRDDAASKEQQTICDTNYQQAQKQEQELREKLNLIDADLSRFRRKVDQKQSELARYLEAETKRINQISQTKAFLEGAARRQQELKAQQKQDSLRFDLLKQEIETAGLEKKELTATFAEQQNQQQNKLEVATAELKTTKTKLQATRESQQAAQKAFFQKETELSVLSKQLKAKSISEDLKRICEKTTNQTLHSLYELVIVPDRFVKAFNAVIGNKVEYLVAEQPYSLVSEIAERVKDTDQNFGLFKAAGREPHTLDGEGSSKAPQGVEALIDCINYQPTVQTVLANFLAEVFYAESASVAYHYIQAHPQSNFLFVTADGQLISKDFVAFNTQSGILGLQNQVNALAKDAGGLEQNKLGAEAEFNSAQAEFDQAERQYQQAIEENRRHEAAMRELRGRIGSLEGTVNAAKRNLANLESGQSKIVTDLNLLVEQEQKYTGILAEIAGSSGIDENLKSGLEAEISSSREQSAQIEERRKSEHLARLKASQQVETLRSLAESNRQKANQAAVRAERVKAELENINAKIDEEFEESFRSDHLAELSESDIAEQGEFQNLSAELRKLRAQLMREGEVDPESIAAFELENKRLTELTEQSADLSAALLSLEKTLERLRQASERKFIRTFEQVAENFATLIPKMYGGGYGSIELDDPEHPLDAGLLITIRPPGKKLKSIELMSGGEKALAATALIVAMFLVRPSPLCILDEVDAPLDDANLNRFLAVVQEMSSETQFLMITHNKHSMSVCDQLVGITMQQPGATQMLQVSLQEAKQHAIA